MVALRRPDGEGGGGIPPLVRADALPEHTEYADTGCALAPSCLRCPFARCRYDEPHSARRLARSRRDREIALLRRRYNAPVDLLAATYGVTRRQIFRVLRQELDDERRAGSEGDDSRGEWPGVRTTTERAGARGRSDGDG